ncbi:MalY/PatB family protein [Pseudonocardia sp. TRM90224]|uniref:MalY/PatB family protein n=1 Tax=Pseudonocardia sp. TRM90224 TaxID=2812678 RepID=UPI001E3FB2F9|nr:aminotransferase class I/II-fold pyridoxal phosphate-dependent enzyme [Pseudonocardia sp. TRM90224]
MFADLSTLRRRRSRKWTQHPSDVLPAFIAEMDVELAPPITEALLQAVHLGDAGYSDEGGLFEAFAAFAQRRLGWTPDTERMVLAPDVMTAVVEVLRILTEPGAGVVITPPIYPPFFGGVAEAGRTVVEVPLVDGGLDLDGLERAFVGGAAAFLLCNPHNPTGAVPSHDVLAAVAELAERYGVLVLSDEIHAPLTLPGRQHTPFARLGDTRSVVFASASKAFNIPGLKCAIAVAGSAEQAALLEQLPVELRYRTGLLGVIASQAAFEHGDAWLDELVAALDTNGATLSALLAEHLPGVRFDRPDAGYLAWLDCRELGLGDDPAEVFLERGRVALVAGPAFGTPGRGHARLNIGTSEELITEAVVRMAKAVG